jgi:hypothetical protein
LLHLIDITNEWVVSKELITLIDEGDISEARKEVAKVAKHWGQDPQVITANITLAFREL